MIYGNETKHKLNTNLFNIIRKITNYFADLEPFAVSKEMYDLAKDKIKDYYTLPLKQKKFHELSHEERIKKHKKFY